MSHLQNLWKRVLSAIGDGQISDSQVIRLLEEQLASNKTLDIETVDIDLLLTPAAEITFPSESWPQPLTGHWGYFAGYEREHGKSLLLYEFVQIPDERLLEIWRVGKKILSKIKVRLKEKNLATGMTISPRLMKKIEENLHTKQ